MGAIAVVPDLYFATRIAATANGAGVKLELIPPQRAAARLVEGEVSLVLVDLHVPDAPALIREWKRVAPGVPVVGFYSHVETALRDDALAAGADAALPRSQFVSRLAPLLARGPDALRPGAPQGFER